MKINIDKILELMGNISDLELQENYTLGILKIKDVNKIDDTVFTIVNTFMLILAQEIEGISSEQIGIYSLLTCQLLSISGLLSDNAPITEEQIQQFKPPEVLPENWEKTVLNDYLFYTKATKVKERFIASLKVITDNNEAMITAATQFLHYHCQKSINEEDTKQRDLGLICLIKLCINKQEIIKSLKELLMSEFKIDVTQFVKENIDMFI